MAGVELTLTTDNSGTQCPHLTSPAGAPSENGSTALSKSKKKRLRKRKKIETAGKGSTEISQTVKGSTESAEVDVTFEKTETVTIELISKNSEEKAPKNTKPVKKSVGESKPKAKKAGFNQNISKDTEVESQQNKIKAPELNIAEDQKVTSKPDLKQEEASRVVMETDKSVRDEVLAQREAKKLAKLAKKNKTGGGAKTAPVQADPKAKQPESMVQLPDDKQSSRNDAPVSAVTAQLNQLTVDHVDGEIVKPAVKIGNAATASSKSAPVTPKSVPATPKSVPKSALVTPLTDQASNKTEKSREEVVAEREVKKQAKLAAKNKKKDSTAAQPKETPAETAKPAPEAKKSEESPPQSVQNEVNHLAQDGPPSEKSKAALRAERRAKQEAQRAAKEGLKKETEKAKPAVKPPPAKLERTASPKNTNKSAAKAQNKTHSSKTAVKTSSQQPKLLSHLLTDSKPLPSHIYQNVHPAIVELGAKYAARVVSGSNARCIALLQALKKVIVDFVTPREKEFSRAMEARLNDSMAYLNASRQSSVSMTNALKHVKSHLTQLTMEKTTDDDARKKLCEVIDTFIKEEIDVAGQAISLAVAPKISDGDTIAIYGCSSLLLRILVESHNEGKDFEVVVVDGGPLYEGREMCRRLVSENIKCTYVLLPAFSYIVGQTTKVLLGAHALLANGCVMSRSGTAVVAMLAKSHNVPVIVCCETYKFCERVQADAFVHNELGPQDKGSSPPSICLMYDMTPPTLVDAVATDLAILPCTSVPVILRVQSNPSDASPYYY